MGRVFETRGDPLVSPKEGQSDFGRNLETENPDYDRMFAETARDLLKPEQIDRTRALKKFGAKPSHDPQRVATNIILQMRSKMRKLEEGAQKAREVKKRDDGVLPDNIPATNYDAGLRAKELGLSQKDAAKLPTREKQTPGDLGKRKSTYDFSGKNPPKEIKKHGKVYRRK
jgi:hypothetical protein